MQEMRLNKYISLCGICSRRSADKLIKLGKVTVNNEAIIDLGTKINITDIIKIKNEVISLEKKIYIILNKPKGYVTTVKEQFQRASILDLIFVKERVYPVGRLDMNSEGLIILTNDGDFANKVIHPSKHISKTYEIKVNKEIKNDFIDKLEKGVDIGGYITLKAIVKKISKDTIHITIFEGKNRQIRRMCDKLGYKVINLKRISIGRLTLGDLKSGEYKVVTYEYLKRIFE